MHSLFVETRGTAQQRMMREHVAGFVNVVRFQQNNQPQLRRQQAADTVTLKGKIKRHEHFRDMRNVCPCLDRITDTAQKRTSSIKKTNAVGICRTRIQQRHTATS